MTKITFTILLTALLFGGPLVFAADPFEIRIESDTAITQGEHHIVNVYLDNVGGTIPEIAGFNFLIQYNAMYLSLVAATKGDMPTNCEWGFFSHLYGSNAVCGNGPCPSGVVRVIAVADWLGSSPPTCFSDPTGHLFALDFLVSNDHTLECSTIVIDFVWYNCGDNILSSINGDSVHISSAVISAVDSIDIADPASGYPTLTGAQDSDCGIDVDGPFRTMNLTNASLVISCSDSIDYPLIGDVNLNQVSYEEADIFLFKNWFLFGDNVFSANPSTQKAATDVNFNGIPVEVADYVYMRRVSSGHSQPNPDSIPTSPNIAHFLQLTDIRKIIVNSPDLLGAVVLKFIGNTGVVTATDGTAVHWHDSDTTRVILFSTPDGAINNNVTILGYSQNADLVSVETATNLGHLVNATLDFTTGINEGKPHLPGTFTLHQNYPNPFNPVTTISFEASKASHYELTIYNALGQKTDLYKGDVTPGVHSVQWDGSGHSSGVYFYRITINGFVNGRKMLLLK